MSDRMPVLFVSHGAPALPFDDVPARRFLIELARKVPRPMAMCVSAHWEAPVPASTAHRSREAEAAPILRDRVGEDVCAPARTTWETLLSL